MKVEIVGTADRGDVLSLRELARLLDYAERIEISEYHRPKVVTDAARAGGRGGVQKVILTREVR